MRLFAATLVALLPLGTLACSSENTSTRGQLITCSTDPGTGVILACAPGDGSGSGSGSGTCQDIDEDGDGEPHDGSDGGSSMTSSSDDHDGDGIPDEDDCDEHQGEDDCDSGGGGSDGGSSDGGSSSADLPYDVKPQLGQMVTPIADAFAGQGPQPAAILSVTMDGGGSWRLAELQAGTPFVVTQDDCDHVGNRDIGRDRVVVTWQNTDGSTAADHLDIRYCGQ